MKYTYLKLAFILPILLASSAAYAERCNEIAGLAYLKNGNTKAAFKHLHNCERTGSVSAATLMKLAKLYEKPKLTGLSRKEATVKSWKLKHLAAVHGDINGLIAIIRLYYNGEMLLRIRPNLERYSCLATVAHSAAGHGRFTRDDVLGCIGKHG